MTRKRFWKISYYVLFTAGFLVFFLIRLKYHYSALETDTGQYGYGAQEMLRGYLPYESFHVNKPPGILFIYAFAFKLFGDSSYVVKALGTLFLLLSGLFVYKISRMVLGKNISLAVLWFYFLTTALPFIQTIHSNTEIFMIFFLVLSTYILLRGTNTSNLVGSGMATGLAMVIKPVAIANWLGFLIWLFLKDRKNFLRNGFTFSMSATIPIILVVFYMMQMGILNDFWKSVFILNYKYINVLPLFSRILNFNLYLLIENPAIWIFGLIGTFVSFFKQNRKLVLVSLQIVVPFILIQYSGQVWGHYFIQIIPFLCIATFYFLTAKQGNVKNITALLLIILVLYSTYRLFVFVSSTPYDRLITAARPGERGDWFDQSVYVSDYVKRFVQPGDYIYNLGREGQLYFYTKTRSPSRYLNDRLFYFFPETLSEACKDLANNKPELVINTLKPPYFSEEWGEFVWGEISKCGNFEIARKEKVYFAEIWFLK